MDGVYQALVAIEPFTLIVTILNLFLQLFLIKKFLLNKVMKVLDDRRKETDRQITDAENARAEALTIKKTYEENMHRAEVEAGEILANAKKTATTRSEEIIRDAHSQAVQIKQKAAADIAQEKKKVLNDAKDEISEIALTIAGKVLGRELNDSDQNRLVDQFIENLGDGV